MKHLITVTLIVFCALTAGIGGFTSPNTAKASTNQVHLGVGIGNAHHYRHHRRRHHRRAAVHLGVHIR